MTDSLNVAHSLSEGEVAPDFTLPSSDKRNISLSDYLGQKNVVLYFYPKDDTPGCTTEACDFRDNLARLSQSDTVVLGVSKDNLKSHDKFIQKHKLPFLLLSDEGLEVIQKYDSWQEKSMYGKKYMGVERNTFLIDKKGVIRKIWHKVKVKGHVQEVLKAIHLF